VPLRDLTPIKPHPVKPHPVSFLADPLLVKERVKIIRKRNSPAVVRLSGNFLPSP